MYRLIEIIEKHDNIYIKFDCLIMKLIKIVTREHVLSPYIAYLNNIPYVLGNFESHYERMMFSDFKAKVENLRTGKISDISMKKLLELFENGKIEGVFNLEDSDVFSKDSVNILFIPYNKFYNLLSSCINFTGKIVKEESLSKDYTNVVTEFVNVVSDGNIVLNTICLENRPIKVNNGSMPRFYSYFDQVSVKHNMRYSYCLIYNVLLEVYSGAIRIYNKNNLPNYYISDNEVILYSYRIRKEKGKKFLVTTEYHYSVNECFKSELAKYKLFNANQL